MDTEVNQIVLGVNIKGSMRVRRDFILTKFMYESIISNTSNISNTIVLNTIKELSFMRSKDNNGKYMSSVKAGSKGQIVIPKKVREMFNISTGDNSKEFAKAIKQVKEKE